MTRERRKILRDLDRAREGLFPHRTCPASRHVHMIVEGMLDRKTHLHQALRGFDPEHMAGSIVSVLESLWKARRWMRWQPNVEGDPLKGGEWVPDLDAIAASAMEARQGQDAQRLDAQHDSAVGDSRDAQPITARDRSDSLTSGSGDIEETGE